MALHLHAGNADLWTAAWLSADALARGLPLHLHAEGPRGTGKTTVLRAFARALPPIVRVRGCPYNCDPAAPHCPLHRHLPPAELRAAGTERAAAPFLELSASAKLATAVGTIDLARLLDRERPEAALLPGTIARAHRGVVFVDEINRLADVAPELTDALLDVMGTKPGRLQVEEAGLPTVVLPVRVTVWAASNPDEEPGPLEQTRLQLADRFDLRAAVAAPADAADVLAVLRGGPAATPGGTPFAGLDAPAAAARPAGPADPDAPGMGAASPAPTWPEGLLRFLADFYVRAGLGSLRALQAWQHAAEGLARRERRSCVDADDVRAAARLTLRGRCGADALDSGLRGLEAFRASPAAPAPPPSAGQAEPTGTPPSSTAGAAPAERPGGIAAGPGIDRGRPRRIADVRPMVRPEWTGKP